MTEKCAVRFKIKLDNNSNNYDSDLESKLVGEVDWETGRAITYQEVFNVFDHILELHEQPCLNENRKMFKAWQLIEGMFPRYQIHYEYENEETAEQYSDSMFLIDGALLPGHGLPAYDGLCFTLYWDLDE